MYLSLVSESRLTNVVVYVSDDPFDPMAIASRSYTVCNDDYKNIQVLDDTTSRDPETILPCRGTTGENHSFVLNLTRSA